MSEKKSTKQLQEELLYTPAYFADKDSDLSAQAAAFCEGYKQFLDAGKTEREVAAECEKMLVAAGYQAFDPTRYYQPGEKVYLINRQKCVVAATIGNRNAEEGFHLNIAHIDSPRLDLRPTPLYEKNHFSLFKTHYYGGIRKYQWPTIPLELHGVVILADGTKRTVNIGGDAGDPKLVITDLLPHLGGEQNKKPLPEGISGEQLNLLLGSRPVGDEDAGQRVKLAVLQLLHEKYGITEDDFNSAELEAVPAVNACEIGLDRSLLGAYGHDDRVCAYAALQALFDLKETPEHTAVCVLADKEEIGSDGVTGMQSAAFDTFMEDLCAAQDVPLRACYEKSFCLSADVTAAYDPNFAEVFEKRNAALVSYGVGIAKYTGARGKGGASDADAETVGYVRQLFEANDVIWQIAELGKVDAGGGGTVAMYMANRNITTIDAGVPVLSMHAPFEVVSKLDCYETYKAMKAVYSDK